MVPCGRTSLQIGWYYLHIGASGVQDIEVVSDAAAPVIPAFDVEDSFQPSCIVGKIRLGRSLPSSEVQPAWLNGTGSQACHIIEEALHFAEPIRNIKGVERRWYITDVDLQQKLVDQQSKGSYQMFSHFPDVADESAVAPPPLRSGVIPWAKKLPRKRRSDHNTTKSPDVPCPPLAKQRRLSRAAPSVRTIAADGRDKRPANHPAVAVVDDRPGDSRKPFVSKMWERFARGRTLDCLLAVMQWNLFQACSIESAPPGSQCLVPTKGLFAKLHGNDVWIVGTFSRRGTKLADVVRLRRAQIRRGDPVFVARFEEATTCQQCDLQSVGLWFTPLKRAGSSGIFATLRFVPREPRREIFTALQMRDAQETRMLAECWGGSTHSLSTQPTVSISHNIRRIVSQKLQQHLRDAESAGCPHQAVIRHDRAATRFVLDIPLPIEIDVTPRRCMTCQRLGFNAVAFPVTLRDIRAEMPGLLHMESPKNGTVMMTKRFLLYLVQSFYEKLNVREVRRGIAEYYSTNALALCGGVRGLLYMSAIPSDEVLRAVLLEALRNFLRTKVLEMQRHVSIYSGTAIRGDGNYDIAVRIATYNHESKRYCKPYSVLLAWTGVDGSLLAPALPSRSEAIEDLLPQLLTVVDTVKESR